MKIIDPMGMYGKIKHKFDKSDLLIAITVLVLGLINNFYFIIGDGVAPDSLSTSYFNIAGKWEFQLGRFFIRYVNYARCGLINKLLIILISLMFIVISVMLLKRLFNIKSKIALFLLSGIICIAPQFTETYMFIYCADAYLIAFAFSIFSVYCLNKSSNSKLWYLLSAISVIVVCALYQAYLGVVLGLVLILLIYDILVNNSDVKSTIIKFFKYMLIIFGGVVIYYVGLKVLLHVLGIDLASYKGANGLGINTILTLPKTITRCYIDFYRFFFTDKIIYNGWHHRKWLYCIISLLLLLGLYKIILRIKTKKINKFMLVFLLILIYPLCVNVMNIIAAGTTINLVTGPGILVTILYPILVLDYVLNDNIFNLIKWGVSIILLLLIWTFVLENTFTYTVREQTFDNYKTITLDLYTKATSLDEYNNDMPWMFSDVIKYKPKESGATPSPIMK